MGYSFIQEYNETIFELHRDSTEAITFEEIRVTFLQQTLLIKKYIELGDQEIRDEYYLLRENVIKGLNDAETFAKETDSGNLSVLEGIESDIILVNDHAEEIFDLVDENQISKAHEQYTVKLESEIEGIDKWLRSNVETQETHFLTSLSDSRSNAKVATFSFLIISIVSVVITIFLWYLITKDHKPL